MSGKRIGYNDEVSSTSAKDVDSTSQLDTVARERFATGTNSTKRHVEKHKPFGKLGSRGHSN